MAITATPAFAVECVRSPVFYFSQALYLEQYDDARDYLPLIERQRAPDLAYFLSQVGDFKQAYDAGNQASQDAALSNIDQLLDNRHSEPLQAKTIEARELTAIMVIHAARLNFAGERLMRAIGLAKKGRQQLDLLAGEQTGSGVSLVRGLYQTYTSSEDNLWARALLGVPQSGNRENGKSLIEAAVEQSPDYAFEAARSLMADINWNRFDTCRYLPMFNQIRDSNTVSFGHRQQRIAANLFCGYLQHAWIDIRQIDAFIISGKARLSEVQDDWLFSARLFALAANSDSGVLKRILSALKPEEQRRIEQVRFALARALDAAGEAPSAAVLYEQTLDSALDVRYKTLARAYLKNPFQPPRPFEFRTMVPLKFACSLDK